MRALNVDIATALKVTNQMRAEFGKRMMSAFAPKFTAVSCPGQDMEETTVTGNFGSVMASSLTTLSRHTPSYHADNSVPSSKPFLPRICFEDAGGLLRPSYSR